MKFFEKINKFNRYISFHVFGYNGFLCALIVLYLYVEYKDLLHSSSITCGDAFVWLIISASALVLLVFVIAFIIFLFERIFYFKIKNKFLLENKILELFRYIGSVFSLIYFSLVFAFLIYGIIL